MRSIRTFILRLFENSDLPGQLRGSLQEIGKDSPSIFGGEQDLLALLQNPTPNSPAESQKAIPVDFSPKEPPLK